MDEEQAVFEQSTVSNLKMWSSTALKTAWQWQAIVATIKTAWRRPAIVTTVISIANFWVDSTGCSGEFHVIKHFQDLKKLISCLADSYLFFLKTIKLLE